VSSPRRDRRRPRRTSSTAALPPGCVHQVEAGVWMVTGTNVNWAVVADGADVTLVDAGYPRDLPRVLAALEHLGRRPEDVVAVALTHAHLDHIGGVPGLLELAGPAVWTGDDEVAHAARTGAEQVSVAQLLWTARRPAGARWVAQTLRAVLPHTRIRVPGARGLSGGAVLDAPGQLVAVPTPGHTSGHTAFLMPSTGVVFSGDALVTGHPVSRPPSGAQLLPHPFNHDEDRAVASLSHLAALPASVVVPGHGPSVRRPVQELVDEALTRHHRDRSS